MPGGTSEGMFEVYKDAAGEYRWRAKANNHQIIATSGEGYVSLQGAQESVKRFVTQVFKEYDLEEGSNS